MNWIYYSRFDDFTPHHLYDVLKLRQEVFVIEQECIYQDLDDYDQKSSHLLLFSSEQLNGYLRILPAGLKFKEASMGRIITPFNVRGAGYGKKLIYKGIDLVFQSGENAVRIEAQHHLEKYYHQFGFITDSAPYDMDGIPHIEMVVKKMGKNSEIRPAGGLP